MSFCLDFDDTHDRGRLHGGVTAVPTGFAVSELVGNVSGRDFITSLCAGLEFGVRLGIASKRAKPAYIMGGWDYAALHGCFIATAVAGKLMGMDNKSMHNALGIAYHQASGNGQSALDGADTKKMGPGFAARAGITSSLFARAGLTGAKNIFNESEQSLCNLFHAGCDVRTVTDGLGEKYEISDTGFKPYPTCRLGHAHIDAVLRLMAENSISVEDINIITPHVSKVTHSQLCVPIANKIRPEKTMEAQFSLPWVLACAVMRKKMGIKEIRDEALSDDALISMAARVRPVLEESLADELAPAKVTIEAGDKIFETVTRQAIGTADNPMSFEDIENKLYECASVSSLNFESERLKKIADIIKSLERIKDINEIISMMS